MLAPLALLALVFGRKKSRGKWDNLVILLMLGLSLGMGLAACGPGGPPSETTPPSEEPGTPPPTETPGPGQGGGSGTQTPPPPTETPEPACPDLFDNGYSYDRTKARDFALKYKDKSKFSGEGYWTDPVKNCTSFVSYALKAGGFLPRGDWTEGSEKWINTPQLFNYLQTIGFTSGTQFYAAPDALEPGHLFLRKHTQFTENDRQNGQAIIGPRVGPIESYYWPQFIESNANIEIGDLVFYQDVENSDDWTHVAIVTDKGSQTTWVVSDINENLQEPLIVDHDGPRNITVEQLPRSVSDTNNKNIRSVIFLHAPSTCP